MPRIKLNYKEGDWFAVPLRNGGYAVGLIARARKNGISLFGYFFGPRRKTLSPVKDIQYLKSEDAILQAIFGDLGLIRNEWPIIAHSEKWDRSLWPMPPFVRVDDISGEAVLVEYSEDDPNHEVREYPYDPKDVDRYPEDAAWGYGAIEIELTDLLSKKPKKGELDKKKKKTP